jgi:hypothetical protein
MATAWRGREHVPRIRRSDVGYLAVALRSID